MRRGGRILLFLVVIIVILVAVTFLVLQGGSLLPSSQAATPTPSNRTIYVVGQPINRNDEIKVESLSTIELPENLVHEWMITDPQQVLGKFAIFPLKQGMLLSQDMLSDRPGMVGNGSAAAKVVSPGLVAISIPINRLNSVAYAINDGDRVNVIATTLFVDLDASFQTILPNNLGVVQPPGPVEPQINIVVGGSGKYGRIDLDPTLNQPVYVFPSEEQRPRLVSQMVLQDIQVLHIGTFSFVDQSAVPPTPEPGGAPGPTAIPAAEPDVITLIVTPQDAVSLTYLLYSGAQLTLTLRAPDDTTRAETEAATLQYLLSQYAIPVPAKLPYGIQPRIDELVKGTPAPSQ
jgi:pilus assembly protein CpaB